MGGSRSPPSSPRPGATGPRRRPVSGLPNVVLTHIAGSSLEAVEDLHRLAAEYVLDLLEAGGRISVAA